MAVVPSPAHTVRATAFVTVTEKIQGSIQQATYQLNTGLPIKVGRTPIGGSFGNNDIVLAAPFVGRDQGRFVPEGIGHTFEDLGGANKFYVQGQPITSRYSLNDGDMLHLHTPNGDYVQISYHNPLLVAPHSPAESKGYEFVESTPTVTIGRVGTTVVLDHPTISRHQATITRQPDGSRALVDTNSANGTFVNGMRVRTGVAQPLKNGDTIQMGPFKLVYRGTRLERQDQRGAMRIDVCNMTLRVRSDAATLGFGNREKTILHDVSLSIAPREFVALVGGSGAGKSSLMKAMLGFTRATNGSTAPVLVNGDDYYQQFDAYRSELGYVPQDDILHGNLSVRAALAYAARLRLPADTSRKEIERRIEQSLGEVEMNTPKLLGTEVHKLSGGQRKRVSIAAELLAEPSLFYLDEPTSGLDPGLEMKMMETLRRLADSGRTVVLVTHATANITQCDHVAFMSNGRLVYFGPPREAPAFFGITNPADESSFAHIYTRLSGEASADHPLVQQILRPQYDQWRAQNPNGNPDLSDLWAMRYCASQQYQLYVVNRQARIPAAPTVGTTSSARPKPARVSPWRQYRILTQRYLDLILRDRKNLLILLLQSPIIACMLLLLARPNALKGVLDISDVVARVEAQNVLFMLVATCVWFGIINAAREITKERPIYRRERLSNLRIVPYLASKVTVLSLLIVIQNIALLAILMLRVKPLSASNGLLWGATNEMFITMMLVSLAGAVIGLLISAWASTPDQAISVVPLVLIPQLLFAGVIFKIENGAVNLLSMLMVSRWGFDALGTIVNVNNLCQLPNIIYNNKIQPQCAVTPQLSDDPFGKQLLDKFPFVNQSLADSTIFDNAFSHTGGHLLLTWMVLVLFIAVGLVLTGRLVRRGDAG